MRRVLRGRRTGRRIEEGEPLRGLFPFASRRGLEPQLPEPKSGVLPLDERERRPGPRGAGWFTLLPLAEPCAWTFQAPDGVPLQGFEPRLITLLRRVPLPVGPEWHTLAVLDLNQQPAGQHPQLLPIELTAKEGIDTSRSEQSAYAQCGMDESNARRLHPKQP